MSANERKRHISEAIKGMTEEEYQMFQDFKKAGNKYLEKDENEEYIIPWSTEFLTFLNMIRVFGDMVSRMTYSKPFRIVIDYDPEQVRVIIRKFTDRSESESSQRETE